MRVIRYAKLPISFDANFTKRELNNSVQQWQPHLNTFHYTGSWNVLPLRSPGGDAGNPVPDVTDKGDFAETFYMDLFPSVKNILSGLQCPLMAVRFLNLKAGAVIKEHRDMQLALEQGEARLHFPVITNPDVEFYCEDERIYLQEGECWYLNANLPHRVSNNSPFDRIHLVVDCKVNDWLKETITGCQIIARGAVPIDQNMLIAIEHYRKQNTDESNRQAAVLESIVSKLMADD
jgi:hypothetical protein